MLPSRSVRVPVLEIFVACLVGCGGGDPGASGPANDSTSETGGAIGGAPGEGGGGTTVSTMTSGGGALAGGAGAGTGPNGSGGAQGGGGGGPNQGNGGGGTGGGGPSATCAVLRTDPPAANAQQPGVWKDVTPVPMLSSSGAEMLLLDPVRPSDMYVNFDNQGLWRSTDYGFTWTHASTGSGNANSGRAWYAAIDPNPCRDPKTSPTLFLSLGWGAGGVWKSSDFGVDWKNVWGPSILREDGTTNVAADVGGDVSSIEILEPTNANHLIASLHGYFGSGGNDGVFETTDGGQTWIDHNKVTFTFQPHADILFAVNTSTWMVSHGTTYPNSELYRTTDSGVTWNVVAQNVFIGRFTTHVNTTVYASGDTLYKSADNGATWTKVPFGSKGAGGMWASKTKLYVIAAKDLYDTAAELRFAPIDDDTKWTTIPFPSGFFVAKPNDGNWTIGSTLPERVVETFDGTHTILVTSNHNGGVWRYVAP